MSLGPKYSYLYGTLNLVVVDNSQNLLPEVYLQKILAKATLNTPILKKDYNGKNGAAATFTGALHYSTNPTDQGGDFYDGERGIILVTLENSKLLRVTYPLQFCFEVKYSESAKGISKFTAPCRSDEKNSLFKQIADTLTFANTTSQNQISNWKTYTNTQYGFQITLSDVFKGYSVTKKVDNYYESDFFTFSIPSIGLSPQVNVEALTIETIPLKTWNSITKDPQSTPPGTVLGKNASYVFLAQLPQDGAGLPSSLLQRGNSSEIATIMGSFKLTK